MRNAALEGPPSRSDNKNGVDEERASAAAAAAAEQGGMGSTSALPRQRRPSPSTQAGSNRRGDERDGGYAGRDNWSLEKVKAMAATWGAGEWLGLGLLRKRRRSGSSALSW